LTNISKFDNYFFWIARILIIVCLVVPLFVSSALLFPATGVKAFVFRILIEMASFFYFYLAIKYKEFRPQINIFVLAIGVFLLVSFLSAYFGADFYLSWWGNLERMMGTWGLIHFVVFFLLLTSLFRTKKDWQLLLQISLGVSSLVSLLAIFQKFTSIGVIMPQVDRVFGTLGNPTFLAGYLIFNLAFAAYLFLEDRSRALIKKVSYGVAFFVQAFALLLSGTRGAYLGLALGLVFCLAIFGFFWPPASSKRQRGE